MAVDRARAADVRAHAADDCRGVVGHDVTGPAEVQWPFGYTGVASACGQRRAEGHLLGAYPGSGYYVVTSPDGLFVTRVDFGGPDPGRHTRNRAVRLAPDAVPGGVLTAEEVTRYRADVARRGGLGPTVRVSDGFVV
ncbi:hypothetical protein Lfu02_11130 [Longispora fulva]|nr:hypothetical protein Lfu02_11130 [Longispora fulva]